MTIRRLAAFASSRAAAAIPSRVIAVILCRNTRARFPPLTKVAPWYRWTNVRPSPRANGPFIPEASARPPPRVSIPRAMQSTRTSRWRQARRREPPRRSKEPSRLPRAPLVALTATTPNPNKHDQPKPPMPLRRSMSDAAACGLRDEDQPLSKSLQCLAALGSKQYTTKMHVEWFICK
jgi:hypothetical protein